MIPRGGKGDFSRGGGISIPGQGRRTHRGTLLPVRGFNTHTFFAVYPQFCTNASLQSLSFSGRSVSDLLQLPPLSSPSCCCFRHDTGFGTDRLMIGCSALSPASLAMLDVLFSLCWWCGNYHKMPNNSQAFICFNLLTDQAFIWDRRLIPSTQKTWDANVTNFASFSDFSGSPLGTTREKGEEEKHAVSVVTSSSLMFFKNKLDSAFIWNRRLFTKIYISTKRLKGTTWCVYNVFMCLQLLMYVMMLQWWYMTVKYWICL